MSNNTTTYTIQIPLTLTVEFEQEQDGRYIADVPELPGVMCYGATAEDALNSVRELARTVVQDQLLHKEFATGKPKWVVEHAQADAQACAYAHLSGYVVAEVWFTGFVKNPWAWGVWSAGMYSYGREKALVRGDAETLDDAIAQIDRTWAQKA